MGDDRMKQKETSIIALLAVTCILASLLTACGGENLAEPVPTAFVNETLPFVLADPMPVPEAKDGSDRGEAIEQLVPMYGASFEDDKYLAEDVKLFRQWQWAELYASLDQKTREEPLHLNTFRLQAEVYLTNSKYNEALAALDSVLRVNPDDIYALGLSAYIKHFMGNEDQSQQRLQALKNVSEPCYSDLTALIEKVDRWRSEEAGNALESTDGLDFDVIVVLGVSPTATGGLSASGVLRLKEAVKGAYYCPDATIIISGGAIDYDFSEAETMKDYLLKHSTELAIALGLEPEGSAWCISEERILLDTEARDTVGNAIGAFKHIEELDLHNLLIAASTGHVMRGQTIFNALADGKGYPIEVHSSGSGNVEAGANEYKYVYVGAARAYGLLTLEDYRQYQP